MSNITNAGRTFKVISWFAYFFALFGVCIVIVLGTLAFLGGQTLHSQLDQAQQSLLLAADEIATQQTYTQGLDVWATEFQTFCSNQTPQDAQLKEFCETNPALDTETTPQVKTDLTTLLSAVQYDVLWVILGIPVVITFTLLALIASGLFRQMAAKRNLKLYTELLIKEYDRGYRDGLEHTAKVLDEDASVLRNVVIWLHNYQPGRENAEPEDVDIAAAIFQQLLSRLANQLNLEPIGQIGDLVKFRVEHYRTQQSLNPGDRARIIEPGWSLEDKVIRKPLVGR